MRSLTSSLPEAIVFVGVPSLISVRLLFCVTVVSLVPEVVVWSFPSFGFLQLKLPVKITWSLFPHNPSISSIEGLPWGTVNSGHVQFTVTVSSARNRQLFIFRCFGQLNVVDLGGS